MEVSFPQSVRELMVRCGVRIRPAEFVTEVSNTLHELEAPLYDELHPELFEQVPRVMDEVLSTVLETFSGPISALDVGCGTGFASQLLLQRAGVRIGRLVCSDISPHMLDLCRKKLDGSHNVAFVLGGIETVAARYPGFDLVTTCSVVHHVVDLRGFLRLIGGQLAPGGFYMMLHEPSSRFYRNPECTRLLHRYKRSIRRRRLRRFLDPRNYYSRLRIVTRRPAPVLSLEARTARLLLERNVIRSPMDEREVRQLVDVHVPPIHTGSFMLGSQGLDLDELESQYLKDLSLLKFRTYGFLGTEYEKAAPSAWQARARLLACRYPGEGAQFCALWRKPLGTPVSLASSRREQP